MFNMGIYPLLLCPFFKFANCHSLPESQGFTMLTRHRRAEVIGSMAALSPGDLVLDVGSGCGHMARWFYDPWAPGVVRLMVLGSNWVHLGFGNIT